MGEETGITVFVGITGISLEAGAGKFESGFTTPRLHALIRNITAAMKNNIKKCFLLICMAVSVLKKIRKIKLLHDKKL